MAFASSITFKSVMGNKAVSFGTFTCTAVTGGDIDTGLARCEALFLQHGGSAVEAAVGVVNETLPVDGSAVTIVTSSGDTGYWFAIGEGL